MLARRAAFVCIMFTVALGAPQPGGPPALGHYWKSPALASLGLDTPPKYARLVGRARDILSARAKLSPPRVSKQQRAPRHMRKSADGGPFVKPANLRLCPGDVSKPVPASEAAAAALSIQKAVHIAEAQAVAFPTPESRYELTPECIAAVQTMADMSGQDLANWRQAQVKSLQGIANQAAQWSHWIKDQNQDVPPSVKALRQGINIAFIAILCDAAGWPDSDLCRELTRGFRTGGDLRDQDSHVF